MAGEQAELTTERQARVAEGVLGIQYFGATAIMCTILASQGAPNVFTGFFLVARVAAFYTSPERTTQALNRYAAFFMTILLAGMVCQRLINLPDPRTELALAFGFLEKTDPADLFSSQEP